MEKELYLKYRNENNPLPIMYEYYETFFDRAGFKTKLDYEGFIQTIQLWPFAQMALQIVTDYYDAKFNIIKIPLKDNKMKFI